MQIFIEVMENLHDELYSIARQPFFPKSVKEAYSLILRQVSSLLEVIVNQRMIMEVIGEAKNLSEEVQKKWNDIREYFITTITQDITYSKNYNFSAR